MARVAIIQFPGVNCEYETLRAVTSVGLQGTILRWNQPLDKLRQASAAILPGGFSYQDRIRAGVVAAKDRIVDEVYELSLRGVPILGICNGAQILVEAGIVPGFTEGTISVALAPNNMPDRDGYHCRWVYLKKGPADCIFTRKLSDWRQDGGTLPCPVAHAEGRFITGDEGVKRKLERGEAIALCYASENRGVAESFPDNPNGSFLSIAALTNPGGNALAIMPHPERASWLYQIPFNIGGYWGEKRLKDSREPYSPGPGSLIFRGLAEELKG